MAMSSAQSHPPLSTLPIDLTSPIRYRLHDAWRLTSMTTLTGQSALQANLAALGVRNEDVRRALTDIEPARDIEFSPTDDGPTATYLGRPLASGRRPLSEAKRLMESVDLVENAVVVITGFALGHHVRVIAERMGKTVDAVRMQYKRAVAQLAEILRRLGQSGDEPD